MSFSSRLINLMIQFSPYGWKLENSLPHIHATWASFSTNKNTKKQWEATCQDLERIGLGVVPVLGTDGEDVPCMEQKRNKAKIAWALKGLPFILKCLNKTASECGQQDWFIIAEDSAKLSPIATLETIQIRLQSLPHGLEILQTGYCRCEDQRMTTKRLG